MHLVLLPYLSLTGMSMARFWGRAWLERKWLALSLPLLKLSLFVAALFFSFSLRPARERQGKKNKSERGSDVSCHWNCVSLWVARRPSSVGGVYWNVWPEWLGFETSGEKRTRSVLLRLTCRFVWIPIEPWLSFGRQVVAVVAARISERRVACPCHSRVCERTESAMASGVSRVEV